MLNIKQQKEYELFIPTEGTTSEELIRSSEFDKDGKLTSEIAYQEGQAIVDKMISYYG